MVIILPQVVRYLARLEVVFEREVPIEDEENEEDNNNQGDESQNTEGE